MDARRKGTGCSTQLAVVGPLIVVGVVIIFAAFQRLQSPPVPPIEGTVAPCPGAAPASTPTRTATPKPYTLRLVADKVQLLTEITELYFGRDDDWDLAHLGQLAGHLQGTLTIGQGGNFVLVGHVELKDGSLGPFAHIGALKEGDFIPILSDRSDNPLVMQYTVTSVSTVKPTDFDVIRNHGYEELTLVTCTDWDQTTRTYRGRVVVHALPSINTVIASHE